MGEVLVWTFSFVKQIINSLTNIFIIDFGFFKLNIIKFFLFMYFIYLASFLFHYLLNLSTDSDDLNKSKLNEKNGGVK